MSGEQWVRTSALRLAGGSLEQWWQLTGVGRAPDYFRYVVRGEWRPVPVVEVPGWIDPPEPG